MSNETDFRGGRRETTDDADEAGTEGVPPSKVGRDEEG
jgi:hypothetical protein